MHWLWLGLGPRFVGNRLKIIRCLPNSLVSDKLSIHLLVWFRQKGPHMSAPGSIVDVIVCTRQAELAKIASDYLKMKSVSNVVAVTDADACIEALNAHPKGMLVIDWQIGAADVVTVLSHNRKAAAGPLRPILLIAEKVTVDIISTAAEYAVSQIFSEEINKKSISSRLSNMLLTETVPDEIKLALGEVQKARLADDPAKGTKILIKLLPKHPTNMRLKCEAAELMLQMGEAENALTILAGIDKVKPPNLRGLHLLGRCLMKLGRFEEGLKTLEQASIFNPHDVDRLVDIGQVLLNLDRVKEAEASFDKALENAPDHHDGRIGKAECKLMGNQVDDALSLVKDVASDTEMASIFNTCAVLNIRQKRHAEGMSLYASALKVLNKSPKLQARLQFNMGHGYRRMGKKETALECMQACLQLDPSFTKASEAIQSIHQSKAVSKPKPTAPSGEVIGAPEDFPFQPFDHQEHGDSMDQGGLSADLDNLLEEQLDATSFAKNKSA